MSQATDGAVEGGAVETGGEDFDLDYTGDEGIIDTSAETEAEPQEGAEEQKGQNLPLVEEEETGAPASEDAPPMTDVEALQARINELSATVNKYQQMELANKMAQPSVAPQQSAATPPVATPQQPTAQMEPGQISNLDFLQGVEDHIELLGTKEGLNSLLNKVASVAYTAAVQSASERVMRQIPSLVQSSAQQQQTIANITGEFYQKNPDLANFRQAVSMAAMQVYNENPSLGLPEMLAEAAKRTRAMLHISGAAQNQRRRTPAQPAGGSIRSSGGNRPTGGQPQLSPQEQQILDLITF